MTRTGEELAKDYFFYSDRVETLTKDLERTERELKKAKESRSSLEADLLNRCQGDTFVLNDGMATKVLRVVDGKVEVVKPKVLPK